MQEPEFKNDHDALITLIAEVRQIREDIKDLKDGTSDRISDHEKRIQNIERTTTRRNVQMTIYISIGATLAGLMIYHILGQ